MSFNAPTDKRLRPHNYTFKLSYCALPPITLCRQRRIKAAAIIYEIFTFKDTTNPFYSATPTFAFLDGVRKFYYRILRLEKIETNAFNKNSKKNRR